MGGGGGGEGVRGPSLVKDRSPSKLKLPGSIPWYAPLPHHAVYVVFSFISGSVLEYTGCLYLKIQCTYSYD